MRMPPTDLHELLALEQAAPRTFRGQTKPPPARRSYGGEVAAQAICAAGGTVPDDRSLHSAHMSFLLPGDTTLPIDFEVEDVRDGGSFSARRVEARQGDRAIFAMSASYQAPAAGPEHQPELHDGPAPLDSSAPGELFAADPVNRAWADHLADFLDVELRFPYPPVRVPAMRGVAVPARQQVWARTRQGIGSEAVLRDAGVAYLSDMLLLATALGPHRLTLQDERIAFATINHTIWFHAPLRVDEWFRYDQESRWAGRGRALCHGEMYDEAGQLCATTMQEGLVRYR